MILTENGVLKLMQRIKSFITSQLNTKAASVHTHNASEITDLPNANGYTKSESDSLFIPKSGGGVFSGRTFSRTVDDDYLAINGSSTDKNGAFLRLHGKDYEDTPFAGTVLIRAKNDSGEYDMLLKPDGSLTWDGQAVQLTSDQRLKQQITKIDNALLDAWEDVEPVQFKYNDAVDTKGNNARLHTGYVVQQIDEACKSHNVDISDYGLYCHEEYPQETEEVEVTQDDGTTKKETRVIREASEHYSLRYTETLVVECAYLRREVSKLKQQNDNLEQRLKMLEQSVK